MFKNEGIIELFGLPGSGKTYYAKEKTKSESTKFITVTGRTRRFFWFFVYFLFHPVKGYRLVNLMYKNSRDVTLKLKKHKLFFLLTAAMAREAHVFFTRRSIIDEGLLQLILSLYEDKIDIERLHSDLGWLVSDKRTVLVFDTDKNIRIKRMRERGVMFRDEFGSEYRDKFVEALESNYEIVVAFLREKGWSVTVLRTQYE